MFQTLSVLALATLLPQAISGDTPCDGAVIAAVQHRLVTAQTWSAIHRSFKKYSGCDDASVAQEYSDRIVHLLATRWATVPKLRKLVAKDKEFRRFILRHIDATADLNELRTVAAYAGGNCPKATAELCKEIGFAAAAAARAAG